MKTIKVQSQSITKWGNKEGELVTIYEPYKNFNVWACKSGEDGELGTCGWGKTEKEAIENWVWREHYFDGGKEKYMPFFK